MLVPQLSSPMPRLSHDAMMAVTFDASPLNTLSTPKHPKNVRALTVAAAALRFTAYMASTVSGIAQKR